MTVFVAAEFDSVDLADLAMGRIHDINGVTGAAIIRNRFEARDGSDDDDFSERPIIVPAGSGFPYMGGPGAGFYNPIPPAYGFDGSPSEQFEPARRHDALLKVETRDGNAARKVSSVLRSVGGRNLRIFQR